MRNLFLGCIGIVLGIVVGGIIALIVFSAYNYSSIGKSPSTELLLPPYGSDLTVTASNTLVSSQLEQVIVKSGLAKQAKVALVSPNIIQINSPVQVSLFGQNVALDASVYMAVGVQRGRITLTTRDVQVGGIGVPPSNVATNLEQMRVQAEDQLNRDLQRTLQGTRLVVTAVRVAPSGVSVDFKMQ